MHVTKYEPVENVRPSHRKDMLHSAYRVLTPQGETVVDCRVYWPGSVAYACIWVHGTTTHASGSGKAGGYGYCKESAAIGAAINAAGVELSESVAGRGVRAAENALLAIGAQVQSGKLILVRCHA